MDDMGWFILGEQGICSRRISICTEIIKKGRIILRSYGTLDLLRKNLRISTLLLRAFRTLIPPVRFQ